jgi:Na+-transporting methylmalonyl-CoA/oxaloacetate decarboxylase gamma subunit
VSEAFDGAGKPFRNGSFRAGIVLLVAVVIAVIVIWMAFVWGMEELARRGESPSIQDGGQQLDRPVP